MQAGELSETFARRAAKRLKTAFFTNPASRFFFRYSEKVSGIGFTVMNIALMNKSHLHAPSSLGDAGQMLLHLAHMPTSLEEGAGLAFTICSAALLLSKHKKLEDLAFRLNGAGGMAGTFLLVASALHNGTGSAADIARALALIPTLGVTASLTLFQKEIAAWADRHKDSEHALVRKFCEVARNPVSISATLDTLGVISLLSGAMHSGDTFMKTICAGWLACEPGFFATDPRMQAAYKKENGIPDGANNVVVRAGGSASAEPG